MSCKLREGGFSLAGGRVEVWMWMTKRLGRWVVSVQLLGERIEIDDLEVT